VSISLSLKTWLFRYSSTTSWSNEELMLSYAACGDQLILSKLYDACGNDLYHFLLTLSEPTLAKDISQLTWLKVMEKKHLYRDSGMFKAWLFTLARNLLIDEYRKTQKFVDDSDISKFVAPELDSSQTQDRLQRFNLALENLPFVQREAFCLQQEMFSLEDIASITHNNIETVKSRLRYAKDNLREQLKDMVEE
tara:strand:+ start:201 stop:782 length:582 start_codon:yes stop_codon:yes gene_type:complete